MVHEKKNAGQDNDPVEKLERLRFEVRIRNDGNISFVDIPQELLPILKNLYPNDSQVKRAEDAFKKLSQTDQSSDST